jgi:hypothetical protein
MRTHGANRGLGRVRAGVFGWVFYQMAFEWPQIRFKFQGFQIFHSMPYSSINVIETKEYIQLYYIYFNIILYKPLTSTCIRPIIKGRNNCIQRLHTFLVSWMIMNYCKIFCLENEKWIKLCTVIWSSLLICECLH